MGAHPTTPRIASHFAARSRSHRVSSRVCRACTVTGDSADGGSHGGRADLTAIAKACGFRATMTVTEQGTVAELAQLLFKKPGPVLAIAKIAVTEDPWALPEKDGAAIGHRFRTALGVEKT